MRRLITLALLLPALAGHAEVESDIPIGIEAVTGVRSGYVFRGFDMANTLLDFQAQGEITLAERTFLNVGGWIAAESGGPFEELAGFLDLRTGLNDLLTLGTSLTYHDYDGSFFESGADLGISVSVDPSKDWGVTVGAYHDFGADAWYAKAEAAWSRRTGEDSYLALTGGISWVNDYYGRDGMNDFFGRASFTYNINRNIAVTPFLGWSLEIDSTNGDGDEFYGGLWLELVF